MRNRVSFSIVLFFSLQFSFLICVASEASDDKSVFKHYFNELLLLLGLDEHRGMVKNSDVSSLKKSIEKIIAKLNRGRVFPPEEQAVYSMLEIPCQRFAQSYMKGVIGRKGVYSLQGEQPEKTYEYLKWSLSQLMKRGCMWGIYAPVSLHLVENIIKAGQPVLTEGQLKALNSLLDDRQALQGGMIAWVSLARCSTPDPP